jgi:hypothetical protein
MMKELQKELDAINKRLVQPEQPRKKQGIARFSHKRR